MNIRFSQRDAEKAHDEWGCNCGPSALAAVTGMTLNEIRPLMGPFEQRGYTNITNMRESIAAAGFRIARSYTSWPPIGVGLVRIQWGGPWITNGKPARWAATATHWIATERTPESHLRIFDVNGGLRNIESWEADIAPLIMESIKRCDGTFAISHSWGIDRTTKAALGQVLVAGGIGSHAPARTFI